MEQPTEIVADANLVPKGYFQMTTLSAALNVPGSGRIKWIVPETQAVRIRDDGVDPTTTVGFLIPVGVCFKYNGDPNALKVIEAVAGAVLNVLTYE
jgi:hypothetical protein